MIDIDHYSGTLLLLIILKTNFKCCFYSHLTLWIGGLAELGIIGENFIQCFLVSAHVGPFEAIELLWRGRKRKEKTGTELHQAQVKPKLIIEVIVSVVVWVLG